MARTPSKQAKKKAAKEARIPRLSEEKRRVIVKVAGILVGIIAFWALISSISYMIHWKADAAVTSTIHNVASKSGHSLGRFLVQDCLGLGSFALIFILGVVSYHLITRKKPQGFVHTLIVTVSGAILASVTLSYASSLFGSDTMFGGGLGGRMGYAINAFSVGLAGKVMTFCFIAFFLILWLVLVSPKFRNWFSYSFEKREKPEVEPETEDPAIADTEDAEPQPDEIIEEEFQDIDPIEPETVEPVETVDAEDAEVAGTEETEPDETLTIVDEGFNTDVKVDLEPFDCRAELPNFEAPSIDLLKDYSSGVHKVDPAEIEKNNARIRNTLLSYKIQVAKVEAVVGPTVTLYKVFLAPGMKSASVKNVENDIAMALCASGVRVVNLTDSVGIEVPNETPSIVPLKSMFDDEAFRNSKAELPVAIGYTITQKVKVFDLADAPHLLVAGATKQGKSVGLNVIVASLLYSKHPSELKMVFIDPKMVEFSAYGKLLHHYLAVLPGSTSEEDERNNAIIKDHRRAEAVLRSMCEEMDQRYLLLSKAGVNQLKDYNKKYSERHLLPSDGHKFLPYIVVVIDEYADLIMTSGGGQEARNMSRSIANSVIRLAQKGRAAGINVIIATQRPSVDVITGLIKANFPTRIAFKVSTRVDSGTILDSPGAEKLIGKGDMLYYQGVKMDRVQCAYVSTEEINQITKFIGNQDGYKAHFSTPYYLPEPPSEGGDSGEGGGGSIDMHKLDENFEEAARMVVLNQKGSTSDLQRRLGMGYSRAGKVMDQLEAAGIVSAQVGSKPREVLVKDFAELQPILDAFLKNQ